MRREWHVQEIMSMPKDEVWRLPDGGLYLTFDDGERLAMPTRSTIESSYYWALAKEWPGAQITKEHHIGFDDYRSDTHLKMCSRVFWDVFFAHHPNYMVGEGQKSIWDMSRFVYQVTNELHNDSLSMIGEYVTTMDMEDIADMLDHPEVRSAKYDFEHGVTGVDDAQTRVWTAVTGDDEEYNDNNIRKDCRAGINDRRQITQVMGPRAFVPDINGESCRTPIYGGYADGMDTLYDRFRESRTASISLYMASGPLEQSEYNNRMCQFLCGVIAGVHYGDCGGKYTVPWHVGENDLKWLSGKFHMVDGKPVVIRPHNTELIGQKIQIRSITTCDHEDPTTPCSVCVGLNALTAPPKVNLGHHLSVEPLARISQTILSTKHVLASTKSVHLDIRRENAAFLRLDKDNPQEVYLRPVTTNRHYAIRIPREQAAFINDIYEAEDVSQLIPHRISALTDIQLIEYNRSRMINQVFELNVSIGGKGSPMTREFLGYMKEVGWEVVGQSLEVKLDDWDAGKPFIRTPRRGEDIMAILKSVSQFLHSGNEANSARAVDQQTPGDAIRELLDIMTAKIDVNFTHVEVFVRALMARGQDSFALPRGSEEFRFLRLKEAVHHRGLGAALAFQDQPDLIKNPESYLRDEDDIPGHPLDAIVQ